jgi:hypothetical protein
LHHSAICPDSLVTALIRVHADGVLIDVGREQTEQWDILAARDDASLQEVRFYNGLRTHRLFDSR